MGNTQVKRNHPDWEEGPVKALQQTQAGRRTGKAGDDEEQQVRHSQREKRIEMATYYHLWKQHLKET